MKGLTELAQHKGLPFAVLFEEAYHYDDDTKDVRLVHKIFRSDLRNENNLYFCRVITNETTLTMEYTVIIEKNPETGMYIGQCKQIPDAISQGHSLDNLLENMKEAIELAIECRNEDMREAYVGRRVFNRKVRVSA